MSLTTNTKNGISPAIMMDSDKWEKMSKKDKKWIDHINTLIEKISGIQTKASLKKFHAKYVEPILEMDQKDFIQEDIQRLIEAYDTRMDMVLLENEFEHEEIRQMSEKDHINKLIEKISTFKTKKSLEKFHAKYVQPILEMDQKDFIQEDIRRLIEAYDTRMDMVLLENEFEHQEIREFSGKQQKWIDRINTLIERIPAIKTTSSLEKFHAKYLQPILEINKNEVLNEIIQGHIRLLINAYDSRMRMIELEKENEVVFSPNTPPPEEFVRVFGKEEYVRIHGKTPPASPKTPPPQDFLRVFGKEEYMRVYEKSSPKKSPPKKRKSAKTQKNKESDKINANKCKADEEINPETGRCRKVCPPGTSRNEKGKCVKTAIKTQKVKKCKDDEEINPETGRCRKRCPEGKVRNEKGNCVNPK
jgi:hypothetical protein